MNAQSFVDNLKSTRTESEKQRIIDAYLDEVTREEGILYTIDYYLNSIEQNLNYLEDVGEIKGLVDAIKSKLATKKEELTEKLEV